MRPIVPWLLCAALAAAAAGCATVAPAGTGGEAKKAAVYSFKYEDTKLAVVVDVELAKRRAAEPYFPLGLKIANKRLDRIIVDRETLFLIDEEGGVFKMPSVEELQVQYDKLVADNKFKSQTGVLGDSMMTGFSIYRKVVGRLFPQTQGGGRTFDSIYIPSTSYMEDLVYFPMPPGGIEGRVLKLRLDVYELGKPLDIAFRID